MTMTETRIEMLTTREVCAVLHCSRRTVVNYISRGLLSPVRLSERKNLFSDDEIKRFIEGRTDNDAAIIRSALALMAEHHAEDKRPMCPKCAQRRVNPGGNVCTPCHEQDVLQLAHKRKWWDANGVEAKQRVRDKAATNAQ